MTSLFENAIASIRMGAEDFRQQDQHRDISAVRNFYAGLLLLAKEALIRSAPNGSAELIIGSKTKPIPDGQGGIKLVPVGSNTIDFSQIKERAKDFGVNIDVKALSELNTIRNAMEHHYSNSSPETVRVAISKGFTVAASLFRQLQEDPIVLLGEQWSSMLETKELYDQELKEAKATLAGVNWYSPTIASSQFKCEECRSEIIEQLDPENVSQDNIELRCRACGTNLDTGKTIESTLSSKFFGETYLRAKETGENGPVYDCPTCNMATLLESENLCANCGEELDYESECSRCGNNIDIQEYLDGADDGLCSYCSYMSDKAMRDD